MSRKIIILILGIFLFTSFACAVDFYNPSSSSSFSATDNQRLNPSFTDYYSSTDISTYWPQLGNGQDFKCEQGTDFLVMIPPMGCSPTVVRSDLLAEQNVPVFCKLASVTVNPLIKVSSIKSISFQGNYPSSVAGISYHPSQAALNSYNTLLGSPVANNIGYVVVVLKKQANETASNRTISGNLTATMYYEAEKAFGVGSSEFYLSTMSDQDWGINYGASAFWGGRGYIRLVDMKGDQATVQLLTDQNHVFQTFTLKLGETSNLVYFPGFYCTAGLRVKLNDVVSSEDEALLNVDGDSIWVRQGSKILNGRCTVKNLNVLAGDSGSVQLSCGGKNYPLSLSSLYKASFSNKDGSSLGTSALGDLVYSDTSTSNSLSSNSYYLAYSGLTQKQIQKPDKSFFAPNTQFVALVKSSNIPTMNDYADLAAKVNNKFKFSDSITTDSFKKDISTSKYSGESIVVLYLDTPDSSLSTSGNLIFQGLTDTSDTALTQTTTTADSNMLKLVNDYFSSGEKAVNDLLEYYPTSGRELEKYGETAIRQEIELIDALSAKGIRYDDQKAALLNKFIQLYPNSKNILEIKNKLNLMQSKDTTNAFKNIYINNDYHSVSVSSFRATDGSKKNFQFYVNGKTASLSTKTTFAEGDTINLSQIDRDYRTNNYLIVKKIDPTRVTVDFYGDKVSGGIKVSTLLQSGKVLTYDSNAQENTNLQVDNSVIVSDGVKSYKLAVFNINVNQVAYVSLVPEIKKSSQANFTFNIGIEKRLIKQSPQQAKEEADKLNKTIQTWTDRNAKLGQLVEAWKGACLATGFGLQIKNLISGFSGEALARQKVMQYYETDCKQKVADDHENYPSVDVCYNKQSDAISKDVDAYTAAINNINDNVLKKYSTVGDWKKSSVAETIVLSTGHKVSTADFTIWEEVRQYLLYNALQGKVSLEYEKSIQVSRDNLLEKTYTSSHANEQLAGLSSKLPPGLQGAVFGMTNNQKVDFVVNNYQQMKVSELKNYIDNPDQPDFKNYVGLLANDPLVGVDVEPLGTATKMIIVLNADNTGATKTSATFDVTPISAADPKDIKLRINNWDKESHVQINPNAGKQCSYTYSNPRIRFYDTDPGRGMPQITPFDSKDGWYVYVKQSSGDLLSNNVKSVQDSGALQFYYICNVGSNGREEDMGGDDICQSFNINNYNVVGEFGACSLTSAQFTNLARRAEAAFKQAASQYANGVGQISIQGVGSIKVEPGVSGSSSSAYQCQDFMSPEDCQLMYNVCDPVICPSSRCNFGGQINVPNVIQSGIIGSLVLCSQNFIGLGGDVAVPICLTGLHAGIEGYISILQAQQKCLKDYAATGKHTGICDEMTAVYKCEFFWRQVAPLVQNSMGNILSFIANGGSTNKGGGEYATFQASFDNMQNSMDYFKNTYASTSFTALKFGDVSSVGTQFCQSFIGTSLPGSAKALNQMLKPESPVQFYAQFSEIPLTSATVPATSQYKVFYHIYSGTDQGTSFQVYLKNPPATSYYATAQTVPVKSGYISIGQEDTQSVDFTAPAGYKQLCVIINNKEECGFTSISTDFSVNVLHDMYAKEQGADTNIQTESQCIQGTSSVLALVNTNPQAGAQEAITPDVSLRGIVRVCATDDPGKGKNPNNWQKVGVCGSSGLSCWLDSSSVKYDAMNVLKSSGTIASAQNSIQADSTSADAQMATARLNKFKEAVTENLPDSLDRVISANTKGEIGVTSSTTTTTLGSIIDPLLKLEVDDSLSVDVKDDNSFSAFVSGLSIDTLQAEAYLLRFGAFDAVLRKLKDSFVSKTVVGSPAAKSSSANLPAPSSALQTSKPTLVKLTDGNFMILVPISVDTPESSPIGLFIQKGAAWFVSDSDKNSIGSRVTLNQKLSGYSGKFYVLNGCIFDGTDKIRC